MMSMLSRILTRIFYALVLSALLIGPFGQPAQVVYALTTTVDDIPGAAIAIPDASCGAPITRTIAVGANVAIADIDVGVNVSHAIRSEVRVTLTSPAGTTVVLIPGTGFGSPAVASPDNYDNYDVMLDDLTVGSLYDNDNDPVGFPYFDRTARPGEPLSAFKGENALGNWTLEICDTLAGTVGTYNRAQLVIASADPNTTSGTVFTDYNDNGIRGVGDTGVSGVTVTAYDSTNAVIATAITDAQGNYSLAIPDGTQVRIEFSTIPADLRPGAFGADSGTTVQFATSPIAGIDLGLSKPDEYCQNNPYLVMPCYINGDPLAGGTASGSTVLYSIPNSAYGRSDTSISQPLATGLELGSTWGLAYQRTTNTVFAAALAKRHAGFGPLGGGGIYAIVVDPLNGTASSVTNFVDIDNFPGLDDGALDDTARGLPAVATTPNTDPTAWDAAGKQAIGDMDIGASDDTLWLINLTDQTLYSLFIGIPAVAPATYSTATPITLPAGATACPASDVRPWAVEVYQGNVYVGVVCSAESTQNVNNLRAYVISTSEAAPGAFSLIYEFALNYPRGVVSTDGPGYSAAWRPWSPQFTSLWCSACPGSGLAFSNQIIYPQPILSDIEFDTNGDMILGFMDRAGHQTGEANYSTSAVDASFTFYDISTGNTPTPVTIAAGSTLEGTSAGDMIRVCNVGGVFTLENNASCGGNTTNGAGSVPAQGPGGGEYYWQDMFYPTTNINGGTHNEVTLGGLVLFPGTDEIVTAVFDPFAIRSGGVSWFSNFAGTRTRAYEIFGQTNDPSRFGKAAGIGDIEGFCFSAPIEIGNRVWLDTDSDGVQDAGEAPIAGVTVELYDQSGNLIATAVTDATGAYFFSSGPGVSTGNHIYLIDELNPNSQYEIRIPTNQAALAGMTLTTSDANGNSEDQRDSDGVTNGLNAVISLTTGSPGDNNHTFDFGFAGSYSLGNRVWLDDGVGGGIADNGVQDGAELGIANVVVNLYRDSDGNGVPDGAILATTTTDASGYYRFDNLNADGYIVEIAASNFTAGNPLSGLASSSVDELNPNVDIDLTDNGIGTAPDLVNGIRSGSIELGPPGPTEPLNEDAPNGQGAPDANANMTVDFGFVPFYSLGNRVWFDTDNNSTRDAGELGVAGVLVELYAADAGGNPIGAALATTTTDADGYYRFDNLAAGNYVVVLPADNFIGNGANDALVDYWSSGTSRLADGSLTEPVAPDADLVVSDADDNGTLQNAGPFSGTVLSAAVTLGPGALEPTGETDLSPTGQGALDNRADMTVDFGFYTMNIGNQVWADINDDGLLNAGEFGINGVTVELLSGDGLTVLATTTTTGNGNYSFTGLPAGDYIVRIAAAEFNPGGTLEGTTSSVGGGAYEPAPDADIDTTDSDDNGTTNGALGGGGDIRTSVVTLTPGAEASSDNATGTTNEPRVDFGVVTPAYSLGNRVWFDTNNNSLRDAGEFGVPGVAVHLYAASGGVPTGAALATTTTDADGYYRFDNLPAGDYIVVLPADNFTDNGANDALVGYWSSATGMDGAGNIGETAAPGPNNDEDDDDDNGTLQTAGTFNGAALSGVVTLGPGASEPTGETNPTTNPLPGEAVDDHSNRTVDFGFYRLELGNLVFTDVDNDGIFTPGTDTPLAGAEVRLFAADGTTQILVGADGILGTADDGPAPFTTGGTGNYLFSGLPAGSYIVQVTPPAGYLSTFDTGNPADSANPDTNADNNDNGIGTLIPGAVSSAVVTLTPGSAGALNNNIVTLTTGTTHNPTVDFGFILQSNPNGITKTIFATNQPFTAGANVAIGEIVTYQLTLTIPTGTFTNAQVVDTLVSGLSFMDCTAITSGTLTTSNPLGFANICANPTVDDAGGGTPTDVGRRVTFSFGTLTNPGAPQDLTIQYRAVVLDSAANQSGVTLDNSAVWTSDTGSIGPAVATVTVVEPDVSIAKTSNTSVVSIGSVITLTLTIDHTAASQTNAYDLVITDPLPAELDIVPATLNCNAGAQPADVGACQYIPGTRTITGTWSNFQLGGGNAQITFDVTIVALPATNVANVAWTSLPGIPPSPPGNPPGQQNGNVFSHERDYDPGSNIDVYGANASLVLGSALDAGGVAGVRAIPDTGFAPNVKTDLSGVPFESYSALAGNIWFEIPALGVKTSIVGVPYRDESWNVAWLGRQAGWLEGSAFPTWQGNSVVTGHVYLSNGLPGPFVNLNQLKYGDTIIVHANGQKYTYEIRTNKVVSPTDTSIFKHEKLTWLTLVTCKEYDEKTNSYRQRVVVRAVLVKVEVDK